MKDVYYFSHDCNARNDPKILALRSVFGAVGYAAFFMLLEIMREQDNYKLKTGKYLYTALSMQMGIEAELIEKIIGSCINDFSEGDSALLQTDGEFIWSDSLLRRMELKESRKKALSEAGKKGNRTRWEDNDDRHPIATRSLPDRHPIATRSLPDRHPIALKESKEKESKEKESKEKESKKNKKNNLKNGGEKWRDGGFIKEYLKERNLDPSVYFGASEAHMKEIEDITSRIWEKFVPGKTPSKLDESIVFCEIHGSRKNENDEWEGFIKTDRLDMLLYAFEAAAKTQQPGNWNYIKGVLRRLDLRKVKTLADAELRDCELQDIKDEKARFL